MKQNLITLGREGLPDSVKSQACVQAIFKSDIPAEIKKEMHFFILRNTLQDCGKVPPNCLKAHLIKTAKTTGVSPKKISSLRNLFKAKVGYKGYYLDNGKLKKV
ncbi:MAG: hypothetical protein Q8P57_03800 [Candidatus Pacearchaeota archaeon]|nr:hypothetical protein [Candidatus Pacearchaeota archaeon]